MTIKIGEKLEKLDPADTYKLVDGADVEGFDALKTQVDQHEQDKNAIDSRVTTVEGHIQTLQQTDTDLTNRVNTAEQHLQTLQQNDVTITAIAHGNTAAIQQLDQSVKADMQVMQSNIAQKISGLHVEDIGNHAFDDINALHFIGATVSDDGLQQATITVDQQPINVSNGQTPGSTSVDVENLEFPGATITTRNNGKIAVIATQSGINGVDVTVGGNTYNDKTSLEFENFTAAEKDGKLVLTPPTIAGGSIAVSDGSTAVTGVNSIEIPTGKVSDRGNGAVEVKTFVHAENDRGNDYTIYDATTFAAVNPLKFEQSMRDPNTPDEGRIVLTIDHAAFEKLHAQGFLAYLNDEENVIGKIKTGPGSRRGVLWFDDVMYDGSPFIVSDRDRKMYGIQESDGKDPNVSGGQKFLIAFRINMKGTADTNDGYVRIYLRDHDEQGNDIGFLTDINGQPMAVQRHYKNNDKLGTLDIIGIVNATALKYFTCHVEDDFQDSYITLTDPTEGVTGLLIQTLGDNEKTGPALLQFESDTNQNISFSSHYLGNKRANIDWLIRVGSPMQVWPAAVGVTLNDGYGVYNPNPVKFGVDTGHLTFADDGTNIADFNFHRIFSAEETQMMRGKEIDVTVTLIDKHNAFRVAVLSWTGKPDEYTPEIYKTRTNGSINLQTGWAITGELFLTEDVLAGDHSATKSFTVSPTANNYAVMIYPVTAEQPMQLQLKQFDVDVAAPFTGYALHFAESDREQALAFSEQHRILYQDNQGYSALRYTINGTDQPMPIGVLGDGLADVGIDKTINVIAGTMARGGEGGLEFRAEGNAQLTTSLRLWNEKNVGAAILFWYELVDAGQQRGTMIDKSKLTITVPAGAKGIVYSMPTFSTPVLAGQRLILRVTGDGPDCAFLQSVSKSTPMLYTSLRFDELTGQGYDDPFSGIDMSQFTKAYPAGMTVTKDVANVASVVIPIDIPDDVNVVVLGAIKELADLTVRPVTKLDWSYSNKKKSLTVSFGETVLVGRVTMGFYL
ncbi:MAG: hypothetical protein ACRCUK_13735 [Plesiomonas shigelloides]